MFNDWCCVFCAIVTVEYLAVSYRVTKKLLLYLCATIFHDIVGMMVSRGRRYCSLESRTIFLNRSRFFENDAAFGIWVVLELLHYLSIQC